MRALRYSALLLSIANLHTGSATPVSYDESHHDNYNLRPFTVDLSKGVPRMQSLIKGTRLPENPEYPGAAEGITLDALKTLQIQWSTQFDWAKEQTALNIYKHFTAVIEGLTVHFIHQKSKNPNAIPLLLLHGWPGSFLEFIPVIDSLVQNATTSDGKPVSFDVVVASLPGFAFSSTPPQDWTIDDTARIFHTLMTDVLGYPKFATHGTDWGCTVSYSLYDNFNASVRAAHFSFLPFYPMNPVQLAEQNITLSPLEEFEEQNFVIWDSAGSGYFKEQATEPNTIGYALYDNPVGQLAWIGAKTLNWSDPRAGTTPSVLDSNEILKSVSLYYLTKSFVSSAYIYQQNPNGFKPAYTKAETDAPMLFSSFKYNVGFWPKALAERVGNLVLYRNHDFGGHFAGLDNPPALIEDIREIGAYWKY